MIAPAKWLLIAVVAAAAAGAGLWVGRLQRVPVPAEPMSGAALAALTFAGLDGKPKTLADWKDRVLVVNFWATWCAPCREEMPEFSRIHEQYAAKGVQFVGIGIDTPVNVLRFNKESPVSYPLVVGAGDAMQATVPLGNKLMALPFTAVLDRRGAVVRTKLGKMQRRDLEEAITAALAMPP